MEICTETAWKKPTGELMIAKDESDSNTTVRKIVVLGGGTAGFLSAIGLKHMLPETNVVIVRSTKLGVIGVGEGTIPSVMQYLHRFLGVSRFDMFKKVSASPKLGIRYLWGKRPYFNYTFTGQLVSPHRQMKKSRGYYCEEEFDFADLNSALMKHDKVCMRLPNGSPKHNPNIAYHLENKKFVSYLENLASEKGIEKIDALVSDVTEDAKGIRSLVLEDGTEVLGDFFVDCSGFKSKIIGEKLGEPRIDFGDALFCDRAVVGGWERTDETYHPFTTAETMDAGWCWRIEHDELINRGYVFCSSFLSEDEAVNEYKSKNPGIKDARVIRFDSNVVRRSWVKNVVAIGNAAGFVEPLEATAIGMICDASLRLAKALSSSEGRILPTQRDVFNRITQENWLIIRDFLGLHYKFNDRLETPFWRAAMNDVVVGDAQKYVDYYREVGPDFSILGSDLKRDFFTAEGYLVMLVGQKVPFDSPFVVTPEEQATWQNFKRSVEDVATKGFSVPEFLNVVRSEGVGADILSRQADENEERERRNAKVGEGEKIGELNWH